MIEYIPESESATSWTEIITVNKLIGKKVPAKLYTDKSKFKLKRIVQIVKLCQIHRTKKSLLNRPIC